MTMITQTPRLAEIASSRMVWILISRIVRKPNVSAIRATPPGTSSCRKALLAASRLLSQPENTAERKARIICTPWLTPMAKMRKGTRIDNGSIP